MKIYKCDNCGKEITKDKDLIDGILNIDFPYINGRSSFILQLSSLSDIKLQDTKRDWCINCIIDQIYKKGQ